MTLLEIRQQRGVILIIAFLTLGILLFLGTYFLSFTLTEARIARSQETASRTFYLAEAGINEAIWKLINDNTTLDGDEAWATKFVTKPGCVTWRASFTREGTLFPGGSFTASIENLECARGIITATSTIALPGGRFARRVIRTRVFRAIGSPIEDSGVFAGGIDDDFSISDSRVWIERGNIFTNRNLIIGYRGFLEVFDNPATIRLEGQALAVRNIIKTHGGRLSATARCAGNICDPGCLICPPGRIALPAIDFDSAANPNSLKNRARAAQDRLECQVLCNGISCSPKCIFTESEFAELLTRVGVGGILTLNNAITYVEGRVRLKEGRALIINGILAADRDIEIGERGPRAHITVNEPLIGGVSGLLSKREIYFDEHAGFFTKDISITGVIYAIDDITFGDVPEKVRVTGGIMSSTLSICGLHRGLRIIVDNERISRVLRLTQPPIGGPPIFYAPTITIEHWEEVIR